MINTTKSQLLLYCFCLFSFSLLGQDISNSQLKDFNQRAKKQIAVFLANLPVIAGGDINMAVRKAGTRTTLRIFSSNAYIQEQSKYSKKKKNWKPKTYFEKLLARSGKTPILIDFDIIEDLSPDKIKKKVNRDGSVSYFGKMIFRQYYCKLKQHKYCLLYTSPSPRDATLSRMPSSA